MPENSSDLDGSPLELAWVSFGTDLYGDYPPPPPHQGWFKVKCAVHMERRPSAQLNLTGDKPRWRCFAGCGGGDVYDLIGAASKNGLIEAGLNDLPAQKRYAKEHGWLVNEEPPEPSVMSPRPRTTRRGPKKKWKPSWL